MAQPQLLQDNFTRMIQDLPRDQLPDDAAWYIRDFIPNLGLVGDGNYPGRLSRRGGWRYVSENIATDATSASSITGMYYFDRVNRLCVMTNNNKFGYIAPPSVADFQIVSIAGVQSLGPWAELQGKLIIPSDDYTPPKYYDGTSFGNLAGTPPNALYTAVWKDRVILASTQAHPNRLYWSAIDDPTGASQTPTGWDQTNAWNDMSFDISGGMAAMPGALLVFGSDMATRIRGSIPPPGSDFIVDDPIFHVGCHYPKSVAVNGSVCCFANEEGVWLTNGTNQPQDLTSICGVKNTWQTVTTASTRIGTLAVGTAVSEVCGGFIGNYYLVTVTRLETTPIAFLFNLADRSCVTLSNFHAASTAMTPQVGDELYFGLDNSARVIASSPIFSGGGDKEDEDGFDIEPYIYTRYYGDNRMNFKRWKHAYLDYYMRDAASDSPTLTVSFDPTEYGNETLGGETQVDVLLETASGEPATRAKIPLYHKSRGMSFKIEQTNPSAVTNIISLSATVQAQEPGRV